MFIKAKDYKRKLEEESRSIKRQLAKLPTGGFECHKNGNHYKWYRINHIETNDGKKTTRTYIKRKDAKYAKDLAKRKYLEIRLQEITHELEAISRYLRYHKSDFLKSDALLSDPCYGPLINEAIEEELQDMLALMSEPYERCMYNPSALKYKSLAGTMHRSKSEVFIANGLWKYRIPFRVEPRFKMYDGRTVYPDFLILHPVTRELYIWEHMGMLEDEEYLYKNMDKIADYGKSGYIINDRLIVTTETKAHPLNVEEIEEIIRRYFL